MVNDKIVDFIRIESSKGYNIDQLRGNLILLGYDYKEIDEAINYASQDNGLVQNQGDAGSSSQGDGLGQSQGNAGGSSQDNGLVQNQSDAGGSSQGDGLGQSNVGSGAAIKRRNPFLVLLFSFITFGIYSIYWIVSTTNELRGRTSSAPNPWLLLLLLVPFVNIVVIIIYYWKYSKAVEELSGFGAIGTFLLLLFFNPVGVVIVQMKLNENAS